MRRTWIALFPMAFGLLQGQPFLSGFEKKDWEQNPMVRLAPAAGSRSLRLTMREGDGATAIWIVLGSMRGKGREEQRYWRFPVPVSAPRLKREFVMNLPDFISERDRSPLRAADFAGIDVIMIKMKSGLPLSFVLERGAWAEEESVPVMIRRIGSADLPGLLVSNMPALAPILASRDAGETNKALKLLAAHLRNRTAPAWYYDPRRPETNVAFNRTLADDAANDTFEMFRCRYRYSNGVDWGFNPTLGTPTASAEWISSLNRIGFWKELGKAWGATGDGRYAEAFVRQLRSFIATQPTPAERPETARQVWHELQTGLRMQDSWAHAWFRFLRAPAFDDDSLLAMAASMVEHAWALRAQPYWDGNPHAIAMTGLHTVGCLFPEFSAAPLWRAYAVEQLTKPFDGAAGGWLEDGFWYELSPGYHQWVVNKYLGLVNTAALTGFASELPSDLLTRLTRACEIAIRLSTPGRTIPAINDTGRDSSIIGMYSPEQCALMPRSALMAWTSALQTNEAAQPPANFGSFTLSNSGITLFRSGGGTNDRYLLFRHGFLGGSHGHKDKLNMVLWLGGVERLYDTGGGDYDVSPYRVYAVFTRSHNTVTVDGMSQSRPFNETTPTGLEDPRTPPTRLRFGPRVESSDAWFVGGYTTNHEKEFKASLSHAAFFHHREIVFVKPSVVVVVDTHFPPDGASHRYDLYWHVRTNAFEGGPADAVLARSPVDRFLIQPLETEALAVTTHSGEDKPEVVGWAIQSGSAPRPALTVRHRRKGSGPQRFVTLLTTLTDGRSPPSVTATAGGNFTLRLERGPALEIGCGPIPQTAGEPGPGISVKEIRAP